MGAFGLNNPSIGARQYLMDICGNCGTMYIRKVQGTGPLP